MKRNRNRAFTLIELLVSCICVATLAAVSIPAVRTARDNTKVRKCANQIRQICIASHNYHDAFRRLPPSTLGVRGAIGHDAWDADKGAASWLQQQNTSSLLMVASFMEMNDIFEQVDPFAVNVSRNLLEYVDAGGIQVYGDFTEIAGVKDFAAINTAQLICPEDNLDEEPPAKIVIVTQPLLLAAGDENKEDMGLKYGPEENAWATGLTSYLANGGAGGGNSAPNSDILEQRRYSGPMISKTKATLETIVDGTSNTLLFGENIGQINDGERTEAHCWSLGGQGRGRGNIPWGEQTHPENENRRILGDGNWASIYGFGSKHEAGVNFVLADGAVVNYPRTIDQEVLYALFGAKDGKEVDHQDFNQILELMRD